MSDSILITIRQLFSRKVFLRGEVSLYHFVSYLLAIPSDNQRIPSYDTSAISLEKYHGSITISVESSKRLRVYTIVAFSFIRTFAP